MLTKPNRKLYLLFVTVILLWGFNWPVNKIGMQYIPAIWHAAFRLVIGCLSMFLFVILRGQLKLPTKKDLPLIIIMGLFQMGLFSMLISLALMYVDAGRSAILVHTTSLWVIPIAIIFLKEKLTLLKLTGFLLGMIGVFVLFSPWSMDWSSNEAIYGHAILLLAAVSLAISICCARIMPWTRSALELMPWQLLVAALPVLTIACIIEPSPEIEWNSNSLFAMAYTGVFATALGHFAATIVSKGLPSITVSLGLLGVPFTGVLSAAIFLGEPVTMTILLALSFIASGLACVALSGKKVKN